MKKKKFLFKAIWFAVLFILFIAVRQYHNFYLTIGLLILIFIGYFLIDLYYYNKHHTKDDSR